MRIAIVEWPDALSTTEAQWGELKDSVNAVHADILIINELPFGPWLADSAVFSENEAQGRLVPDCQPTLPSRDGHA